jgi:hypothetical protein
MIKIVLLLLLFLVYVSVQQEGLRNYTPIVANNKVYGVNVIKNDPEHIYTLLTTPGKKLYDEATDDERAKYKQMARSDILLDMQYFNNASYLIFQLSEDI